MRQQYGRHLHGTSAVFSGIVVKLHGTAPQVRGRIQLSIWMAAGLHKKAKRVFGWFLMFALESLPVGDKATATKVYLKGYDAIGADAALRPPICHHVSCCHGTTAIVRLQRGRHSA